MAGCGNNLGLVASAAQRALQGPSQAVSLPPWLNDRTREAPSHVGTLDSLDIIPNSVKYNADIEWANKWQVIQKKKQDTSEDIHMTQRKSEAKHTLVNSQTLMIPVFISSTPQRHFSETQQVHFSQDRQNRTDTCFLNIPKTLSQSPTCASQCEPG